MNKGARFLVAAMILVGLAGTAHATGGGSGSGGPGTNVITQLLALAVWG